MVAHHWLGSNRPPGVMPFGKYKGRPLSAVPPDYLTWLLGKPDLGPGLRAAVERLLDVDLEEDATEPSPASAAVAFPLIVWKWERHMRAEFDSPFQLVAVEAGLEKLKELCSEYTGKGWAGKGGAA